MPIHHAAPKINGVVHIVWWNWAKLGPIVVTALITAAEALPRYAHVLRAIAIICAGTCGGILPPPLMLPKAMQAKHAPKVIHLEVQ